MDKNKSANFASMKGLSILIPEYKDDVVEQARLLAAQCKAVVADKIAAGRMPSPFGWEIIVADDGTPDDFQSVNAGLESIEGCKLIRRGRNYGRSSTRNFLALKAKFDNLLFIDSGLKPNPYFVEKYVENIGKSLVVCGNIEVDKACINMENLRCKNELKAQKRFTAEKHAMQPYKNFHSGNFMIDRQTMLDNPMREDITTYGYEDTLFGKMLSEKNISIRHIHNPALFVRFESNERFLEKTEEGISTLYKYRKELVGYSPLLDFVNKLSKWHLLWIPHIIYIFFGVLMSDNLKGRNPSVKFFSLYRVCLLSHLFRP